MFGDFAFQWAQTCISKFDLTSLIMQAILCVFSRWLETTSPSPAGEKRLGKRTSKANTIRTYFENKWIKGLHLFCRELLRKEVVRVKYSRLSITRTFKGNQKKVRVIGSSKKIAESKVKNSFYRTMNILITFNCRNVKWKSKLTSRL